MSNRFGKQVDLKITLCQPGTGRTPADETTDHRPTKGALMGTKLMTVDDVADYLDVPKSWVYGNWRTRAIPFRKVGQSLRVRPSDLEKWFEAQEAA
ncbi:helix-turn-helix domain-containing protein [Streptomyces sp. ET3-23]|uniref:helix-turn-helix domain-containing protein n=1 Tax=Streptomyces sp. ET3-23 TaxID=2885643 RepID=UPI001D0F79E0|nr:helix-turn-helix domain-containing protein [Streptomyces sp. ET3-23]MCC2278511.1 helix-turn-helix domain-containing protein [Streptomyces sp. ET3-23]